MLTRFNKKLGESNENNFFNQLNHLSQQYKPSNSPKDNYYLSLNETINLNSSNILSPSSTDHFTYQSPDSPTIKPFNYVKPITPLKTIKSPSKSKPLSTIKLLIKGGSKTIKGLISKPLKPESVSTKELITVKLAKPIKRSHAKSLDNWSINSDNSIDSSLIGISELTKCEQIRKHLFRLKTILLVISVIGLIYQAYGLSEIYFRYPTIVDVLIEQNEKIILPSITVCSPIHIAPSELQQLFTDRPEVDRMLNRYNSDEKLNPNEKKAAQVDYLRKYFHTIYLNQVTFNLSTFLGKSIQETAFINSCHLSIINSSDVQIKLPCKKLSSPMVTLTSGEKCFTYFSEIGESFDSIENFMSFDEDGAAATAEIQVILQLNVTFDPNYEINLPSFLYVHASNEIMSKSNRFALEPNRRYDVFYWRTVSERLEPFYCRSYSRSIVAPQSKIDCINRCSTEFTFLYCQCLLFKPPVRIETFPLSARICPQIENNFIRSCRRRSQGDYSKACRTKCTDDCVEQVYDYSVTAHELTPEERLKLGTSLNRSSLIEIQVTRKLNPDVVYRQKYQLEFEQYFSNFCSLLGFWLEITVLTFYDQLKKKIFLLYRLTCYVKTQIKQKGRKINSKLIKI